MVDTNSAILALFKALAYGLASGFIFGLLKLLALFGLKK